jgi:uncharacterized protein
MKAQDLIYTLCQAADRFLAVAQPALERHEAAHGLMLGVGLRLIDEPYAYGSQPYMATVESRAGLRVAALMTPPHKLQLYAHEDRDGRGLGLVAEGLLHGGWPLPGVLGPQAVAEAFATLWRQKTGAASHVAMWQRIYELRRVSPLRYPPGEFRPAAAEEIEFIRPWVCGFHRDCFRSEPDERVLRVAEEKVKHGTLFLWVDGTPASMAGRGRPTPHGEAVSLVYTPPERRRRGYASAVVARLSQHILDEGKQFCTLHADLANPTSNHIYQQIGYTAVADVVEITFQEA